MYLLLAFAYQQIKLYFPLLIPLPTINNTWILVKRSNFTSVFFKAACHANPGAERNFTGSNSYIIRHISKALKYIS